MSIRRFVISAVALSTGILALALPPPAGAASAEEVFLAAGLRGANEVGTVGDGDGSSTVVLRIKDNEVAFAIRWNKIDVPKLGHIHLGARGVNGGVKLDLITGQLPATVRAVTGTVTADPALIGDLLANPEGFYANLHNDAFPSGAVRGQLHKLNRPVDLRGVLQGGDQATLSSEADGAQEVQGGDPDGSATWWLRPSAASLAYTATWQAIGPPTQGHIHRGGRGVNGDVVADLFSAPGGLQQNLTGVAGEAPVARSVLARIVADPGGFYSNLHTAEFDGGAVRGQLSGVPFTHPRSLTAEVLLGAQIYQCTVTPTGTAFTQFGVAAALRHGIKHSFVQPVTGPPQWIAPDGSAVRGSRVLPTIPNGEDNIPELVLNATQAGASSGLLAHATLILRLNTKGGVAPKGPCTEGTKSLRPYGADYLFLG